MHLASLVQRLFTDSFTHYSLQAARQRLFLEEAHLSSVRPSRRLARYPTLVFDGVPLIKHTPGSIHPPGLIPSRTQSKHSVWDVEETTTQPVSASQSQSQSQ